MLIEFEEKSTSATLTWGFQGPARIRIWGPTRTQEPECFTSKHLLSGMAGVR